MIRQKQLYFVLVVLYVSKLKTLMFSELAQRHLCVRLEKYSFILILCH